MTTPLKSPAGEVPAQMDDTPVPSTAHPHTAAGSAPAEEPPAGGEDPRPEMPPLAASQASDTAEPPLRTAASPGSVTNTTLLVGIVAAFLSVLGTAVGLPLYLLDGNVRELGDEIETLQDDLGELEDKMDVRFVEQDAKFDAKFVEQDAKFDAKLTALADKMDARFVEQDAKFDAKFVEQDAKFDAKLTALADKMDARFAEQDAKFDARFAEQDAKFAALENGQVEIDRKLTALIAHLHKTEAVETALEGRLE